MVKAKQLTLELNLNDKATKELIDFAKKLEGTGKKGKKTGKDIERGFKRGSKAVKGLTQGTRNATKGMGGMIVKIAALTGAFRLLQSASRKGFSFIEQASKFEEEIAKFGVVFGQEAERVAESLDEMSGAMNRSRGELVAFASSFQDIFVPLGFARKEASDLSLKLTELAIDVGSFNNRLDTDVIRDFQSALVGSSITVRKYGILIDQARINQVGWALGLAKQGDELTAQQRVIARYNILLQDSADAVGDAVRTADSFANTMKGLSAQISDTGIAFGQELQVAVLETIESMGGIEGVVDVVKVGFAAITSGTEFLIRTLGRLGVGVRELIASVGGANNAVALLRGELEDTGASTDAFAGAWQKVPGVLKAVGEAAIRAASLVGHAIANALFKAFGSTFDAEVSKMVVRYSSKSFWERLSFGGKSIGGIALPSINFDPLSFDQEAAHKAVKDGFSRMSPVQLKLAVAGRLEGDPLKAAQARIATGLTDIRGLFKDGIDADAVFTSLRKIDSELDQSLTSYETLLASYPDLAPPLPVFSIDLSPEDIREMDKIIGEATDRVKVLAALEKDFRQLNIVDLSVGQLIQLGGLAEFESDWSDIMGPVVALASDLGQEVKRVLDTEGFTAKDRSFIRAADFINMDSSADRATVMEVGRRFSATMKKVGAEIAKVADDERATEDLKVQLAPAFKEEMLQVLRDAEEFGVKLPAAAFDAVIARARDLGVAPEVIAQFRVLAAGLVQETKEIVDGVTDTGGQLKINFGKIGKDAARDFLTALSTIQDFDGDAGLDSFAAKAEEMGLKVAPSLVEPLRQHIKAFGLEDEFAPIFDRLVAVSEKAGRESMEAFGAARVIMDATVEIGKIETDETKTDEEVAKLVKGLQDRIQLSLGRLESLGLNEEQLLALGAHIPELIAKGASESDALGAAAATVLETLQAEFATLQAELAAGVGLGPNLVGLVLPVNVDFRLTGEQVLDAKLAADLQAIEDSTILSDEQKVRQRNALTKALVLFKDAQIAATAAVHEELRASATELTTFDATVLGIDRVAAASKLASEAKLKDATITAEDLKVELDLHDKIREASLKTANQAESVRRATETLEAARSAVASGLGDNAAVVAAQRALNEATVEAVKGISDEDRAALKERLNSALNIQIGLQENLNAVRLKGFEVDLGSVYEQEIAGINAAAEAAIRAAEALVTGSKLSVDAKNAEVEAINAVRDAQLELAEDFALGDSLQRAASLAAELGTAFDIQRQAAISAAQAAETLAIASAGTSDLARENLQRELELLDLKLARTLKFIGLQERGAKGAKVWGDLLGDQEAGVRLQAELAGAFDTAVGGLARSFVDASTSWADFRDQFLMSISQMIVKALLLASIEATIRAFSLGFSSGGVAEGVDTNAMGGVTTGVGSMSTGPAPPNSFAMGGVQGGTMKAHSDDLGFERGAKIVKAFADGGIMEGVGSHMPVSAFANGGVMGGLPVHQYAIGGIARTPQLAVFGEGRGAEAFVPLPDGKSIPVKMDGSSGPISVNLTVASLDPRTAADVVLAQMPKIRKEWAAARREGTDRSLTEGVRGAARR